MIFALRQPKVLLGLLVGFLVGITVKAVVQRRLAGGRRRPGWARQPFDWRTTLDPYGAVAAFLGGVGWGARVHPARQSREPWLLLAGLAVHAVLAVAGFALFVSTGPGVAALGNVSVSYILYGSGPAGTFTQAFGLGVGMINLACGLLMLLPLPPLELGNILWHRLPRTPGSRRLAYRLLEEQWGVGVVLLLLLLPIAGQQPVLVALVDTVGNDILRAL
jgi:hypothetical protein